MDAPPVASMCFRSRSFLMNRCSWIRLALSGSKRIFGTEGGGKDEGAGDKRFDIRRVDVAGRDESSGVGVWDWT